MERQNLINLKFLDIVKSEKPVSLSHIKTLCDNYNQYVNADEVPPMYKELREMNVTYVEIHDALRWLLDIGILLREIIKGTLDDHIRAI